jgi:hypothetical protein
MLTTALPPAGLESQPAALRRTPGMHTHECAFARQTGGLGEVPTPEFRSVNVPLMPRFQRMGPLLADLDVHRTGNEGDTCASEL